MPKTRIPSTFTLWLHLPLEGRVLTGDFCTQSQLIRFLRNSIEHPDDQIFVAFLREVEGYLFVGKKLEQLIACIQGGVFYHDLGAVDHVTFDINAGEDPHNAAEALFAHLHNKTT
jgi:hypothetical protein